MKTMQILKQIFKIYLVILIFISVLNTSMCLLEDIPENNNTIKTENIQSLEEKTEEPLKLNNQISFFNLDDSNSFLPKKTNFIDDDDNQIDAQDGLFIAESGYQDKSLFKNDDSSEIQTSNKFYKNNFVDEKDLNEINDKPYSDVIKTKKFTKTCQCSFTNEDDLTFFDYNLDLQKKLEEYQSNEVYKEPIKNFEETEYFENLNSKRNFLQNDNRDEDDDDMNKLTKFKRSFMDSKQELCDENFSNEELKKKNNLESKFDEKLDNDLNKQVDDLDENYLKEDNLDEDLNENLEDRDSNENYEIDVVVKNSNNLDLKKLDDTKGKIFLPIITNLSPTSSSELIFNELNLKTKQLDNQLNQNSFQIEKLKNVIQEEFLNSGNETSIEKNDIQENDFNSLKKFLLISDDNSKSTNKKKNFFDQFLTRSKRKASKSMNSFIGTTAKSLL